MEKSNKKRPKTQIVKIYSKGFSRTAKPRPSFVEKLHELGLIGSLDDKGITSSNYKDFL